MTESFAIRFSTLSVTREMPMPDMATMDREAARMVGTGAFVTVEKVTRIVLG